MIVIRCLLGAGVAFTMTWALKTISVAEATLLNNISPLLVPFIAYIWIKDRIAHGIWPCLAIGFLGVLIILHPWGGGMQSGMIVALISGVLSATLVVAARQIAHEPLYKVLFYYALIMCLAASPSLATESHLPSWNTLVFTLMAGVAMLASQFFFTLSLRHLRPLHIAPLLYLIVPFSGIFDWIVWRVHPSLPFFFGTLLVILGGLLSLRLKKWAVLLVEPIASGAPYKTAAREMGYKVIAIYGRSEEVYQNTYHMSRSDLEKDCDLCLFLSDLDVIVQSVKSLPFPIRGCVPAMETGLSMAMHLSHRLHLIANPIEMLPYYRDKGFMRKKLREYSLPCPDFAVCRSEEEVRSFVRGHSLPLVIKTPRGAGSEQVFICDTEKSLVARFQEILSRPHHFGMIAQEAVIEEFLDGTEYVIDMFADGTQIRLTDAWVYEKIEIHGLKNIYYNIFSVPFDDPVIPRLTAAAERLSVAFQIQKGPVHFEIKDDLKRGPTLVEINVRLPGAQMATLIRDASNWNPFRSTIEVFTRGKTTLPREIKSKHLAVVFCPQTEEGTVERIEGIEEIQRLPSYVRHVLYLHPGEQASYTQDLQHVPCTIFMVNTDRAQLLKDAAAAHQFFRVVFASRR